ncbi:flavodoxin [Catenibacterium mitsuokai]|uniref:flavodoxin n=1 Tax=Catenibacterium mitsuokai TaxID=100886 RepID=UPI003F921CDA
MSKSLIVYFSHNKENYLSGNIVNLVKGNVQIIAETLSTMIDADVYQIKEVDAYPFDYHECTSHASEELKNNARPQILDPLESIDEYDTIYLGCPNWWLTMPTIVMTFLESYDFTNKHIYPICSHEGSGMGRSESDLKKLCPNSIVHKGLNIQGSHVDGCRQQLERWLGEK